MPQFLGFGDGRDGDLAISGDVTESLTGYESTISATSGASTGTVSAGLSFAQGDFVTLIQARVTGVGAWEMAQVQSYSGTTLTFKNPLTNTYTNTGDSLASVRLVRQYRSITIQSGGIWRPKDLATDGTGGLLHFMCSGKILVASGGSINLNGGLSGGGAGYDGVQVPASSPSFRGEGTSGPGAVQQQTRNGNGGGGSATSTRSAGGAGAHASAGADGGNADGTGGQGGEAVGTADLTTIFFGGGGGAALGGGATSGGGGGILICDARYQEFIGTVGVSGANAGTPSAGNNGGGGGGAGGSVLLRGETITGLAQVTAAGGVGGTGQGTGVTGPNGSAGRVRVEACSISGDSTPAASKAEGGRPWCVSGGFIY